MREKVTFTYKDGFTRAEFKNVSDKHLDILKRDICLEQLRRKEQPQVKPSFAYKLKRFIRRLNAEIQYQAETTVLNSIVGSEQAASINYLGLVEE